MNREGLQAGLVWILDAKGDPWGAGVLIGPRRVLTCAHVVAAALGGRGAPGAQSDRVLVQFTHVGATHAIPAHADARFWFEAGARGPGDPGAGDLAVLDLDENASAGAAPVDGWVAGPDHGVDIAVFGLPEKHDVLGGGWAGGELVGTQPSGWV